MREKFFKKGITRRLFSVVLALAMVISLLPMNSMKVYAADEPILADTITASGDYAQVKTFYGSVYSLTAFVTTVNGSWSLNGTNRDYIRVFNKEGAPKISKLVFHLSQDRYSSDYYTNSGSISFNGKREIIVSNISNTVSFVEIYNRQDYTSEFAESVDIYYTPHTCSESEVTESNKKAGQAATCTENGWSEYWICSCGKVYAPEDFLKSYDNENAWKTGDGKIAALGHDWEYTADGTTITASCNRKATCGQADITLTLIADDADYSENRYSGAKIVDGDGIEIRSDNVNKWKSAGLAIPNITLYMSNSEGSTEGTADVSGLDKHGEGYYYAAVTVGTGDNAKTAKAAFTIGEGNPWPTVTDQNKINLFFASVVGSYKDESEPDNYWITISGDATSGFDITYCGDRMESIVLQQKDNNYYFGNADAGFTFTLDENGKLQNCYEADILNHMVAKHKGFPYDHYHGWSYAADGAALTATCLTPSCGETATLTLSATSPNYSGSAYTGASLNGKDAWESAVGAAPTIKYIGTGSTTYAESTTAPSNAGTYKATISVGDKTAEAAFEITKASQDAPEAGTGYTIDYTAETITAGTDYEVSTSNESLSAPVGGKVTPGTTYYVRKKGNDNNAPSVWTAISVPVRPAAPTGLESVMTTGAGNSDGKITGVSDTMEYSTDGTTWTAVSGTEITGLLAGKYKIRVKATSDAFASTSIEVTVSNPHIHAEGTYEAVEPSEGEIKDITGTKEAPAESNPYSAAIKNSDKLESLVNVTPEEKAQGVNVWIEVVDASNTMAATDKAAINAALGDETIGLLLDATLFKKVGDGEAEVIHNVNGKIKVSLVVPENLRKDGRTFEIIRVHDGVATVIPGTYDATSFTFTFETDKFSAYALVYEDKTAPEATTPDSPKTGDAAPVRNVFLLMLMAMDGLMLMFYLETKKKYKK